MSRHLLAMLACVGAACSTPVRSSPVEQIQRIELPPPVVDSAPRRRAMPEVDLSGSWLSGSTNEPDVRYLTLQLECSHTPSYWMIEQRGDTVRAWTNPASWAQGIATPIPPRPVTAGGRIAGLDVRMESGDARYVLRYDRASGHLRGTLNDAPFWAMRLKMAQAGGCIAVP